MAVNRGIWLTVRHYNRLRTLYSNLARQPRGMRAEVATLKEILDIASIANDEKVPLNLVTMNSHVVYEDVDTGEEHKVILVYPEDAEPAEGKVSVLSPIGTALLGESQGNEVELPLHHGHARRIHINRVVDQTEFEDVHAF